MAPAYGRPPSKEPKVNRTMIRLSDDDIEMLEYCCEKTGKSRAEIIRRGIKEMYAKLKK